MSTPVSGLNDSGAVQGGDLFAIERGGVAFKVAGSRLLVRDADNALAGNMLVKGNMGLGTLSPIAKSHVVGAGAVQILETATARGSGNNRIDFYDPTGRKGTLGYRSSSTDAMYVWNDLNAPLIIAVNGAEVARIDASAFRPGSDNTLDAGSASFRLKQVFAGTSTINTSDARTKRARDAWAPTDAERAWARSISIGAYRLLDAIAEKGEAEARIHWGVIAQDVHAAGIAAGITDPFQHGFLCRDLLTKNVLRSQRVERQKVMAETRLDVEIVDGQPRQVLRTVDVPVFEEVALLDTSGAPVMVERETQPTRLLETGTVGEDGKPILTVIPAIVEIVPQTYPVPVMETVEETVEVEVPDVVNEEDCQPGETLGQQRDRWGIRYTELLMFLLACAQRDQETEA